MTLFASGRHTLVARCRARGGRGVPRGLPRGARERAAAARRPPRAARSAGGAAPAGLLRRACPRACARTSGCSRCSLDWGLGPSLAAPGARRARRALAWPRRAWARPTMPGRTRARTPWTSWTRWPALRARAAPRRGGRALPRGAAPRGVAANGPARNSARQARAPAHGRPRPARARQRARHQRGRARPGHARGSTAPSEASCMATLDEVAARFCHAARAHGYRGAGTGDGEGAGAHLPAGRRARPARGRAGHGQDAAGARAGAAARLPLPAHPVHARPDARRPAGHERLQPEDAGVRVPARADLRRPAARRRDQPHAAAHAGGAARVHAGGRGHRGRRRATASRPSSPCSPPRTRSSSRAPIRCPRRSATAS